MFKRGFFITFILLIVFIFAACGRKQDEAAELIGYDFEQYLGQDMDQVLEKLEKQNLTLEKLDEDREDWDWYKVSETIQGMDFDVELNFFQDQKGNMKLFNYNKWCYKPAGEELELVEYRRELSQALLEKYGETSYISDSNSYTWEEQEHPTTLNMWYDETGRQYVLNFRQLDLMLTSEWLEANNH